MFWIDGLAVLLLTGGLGIAVWLIRYVNRQTGAGGRGFRRLGTLGPIAPRKGVRWVRPRRPSSRDRRPVPPRFQ